jgi:hypothetical protein
MLRPTFSIFRGRCEVGEVIALTDYIEECPAGFTINAVAGADGNWMVNVLEFHDHRMPTHEMFREIADAMIPIAGGFIHSAEALNPTERGCIVASIQLFSNGNIDFHSEPINTKERKAWFARALRKVSENVTGKKRKA